MYDMSRIKAIPVADVALRYGIELQKKHGRLWGKLRNENTASFSINIERNIWYDFGAKQGGSVIDLVAELEGITAKEAIKKLAEDYNIENEVKHGWQPLTDSQYRELGIQPERATMNFDFDLRIHTPEQLSIWEGKYGVPVRTLAEKYPEEYNKLILKIAKENITLARDAYFTKLRISCDPSVDVKSAEIHRAWAKSDAIEINSKVELLSRAVRGNYNFDNLKVDPSKDESLYKDPKNIGLSQDEVVREKIVKIYKRIFNFQHADYITIDQAKEIEALNRTVLNDNNKYLSLIELKSLQKELGEGIQKLSLQQENYNKSIDVLIKENFDPEALYELAKESEEVFRKLSNVKELFNQCSKVLDGFREANLSFKNDTSKQNVVEKKNELIR